MTMLCMIPARAGSKRLPHKNTLPLAGKPMIAYSIEAARASGLFERIYVCTESERIADIARQYGADVPMLVPADLCGDLIPSHVPCTYLAEQLQESDESANAILVLQPTSPLRSVEDIRVGVERFLTGDVDFVISATLIDPHYFHWALRPPAIDAPQPHWQMYFGSQYLVERPLLPPVYRPNGSIKIARLDVLKSTGHFFGEALGVIETPEERSVHVGTRFDFELCDYLLSRRRQ